MEHTILKAISWVGRIHLCLIMCVLSVCPTIGQTVSKKKLSLQDFDLWSTQHSYRLSPNGNWLSWVEDYDLREDTLKLIATTTKKKFAFPNGEAGTFSNDGKWFAASRDSTAILLNLETGKQYSYHEIKNFRFTDNGKFIALYKGKSLIVSNLENNREIELAEVTDYAFNKSGSYLAYITHTQKKGKVTLMDTRDFKLQTIDSGLKSTYRDIGWNTEGEAILFMEDREVGDGKKTSLHYFNSNGTVQSFSLDINHGDFPQGQHFAAITPFFSKDGSKIFFYTRRASSETQTNVEVWSALDPVIYPLKNADWHANPFLLAQWAPVTDSLRRIGTEEFPEVVLTGDHKKALVYHPWAYEPQEKRAGDIDLYLLDIGKGARKPLLKAQENYYNSFVISPSGNYIAYFKEGNWWSYSLGTGAKVNLSHGLGVAFSRQNSHYQGESTHCGFGAWLDDDSGFFVRDSLSDYWLLHPVSGEAERISFGREKGLRFELVEDRYGSYPKFQTPQFEAMTIAATEGLLLIGRGPDNTEGLYFWKEQQPLRKVFEDKRHISKVRKARNSDVFSFTTEAYDSPPCIQLLEHQKLRTLAQTNPQAARFESEKMEVIRYKGIKDSLKGLLYYPQGYRKEEKYPMVVHIYERQSGHANEYVNPSLYSGQGFNPKVYTSAGYFVLLPDIDYEIGNPGYSALECVSTAVESALMNKSIDRKRLGLIGHSFGGYETSFIITQSALFAAAVSGAGIHDLRRDYFSIDPLTFIQNKWMYETYQLRFGKPYFEIRDAYIKNCPIHHAASINTPLLLWAGQLDVRIDFEQSVEMYLALKGLGKEVELLVYPNEGHALFTKNNQRDLTLRIKKWFDRHLGKQF